MTAIDHGDDYIFTWKQWQLQFDDNIENNTRPTFSGSPQLLITTFTKLGWRFFIFLFRHLHHQCIVSYIQGNFEKLTREELVIIEGENVLQPAAIQKVIMIND